MRFLYVLVLVAASLIAVSEVPALDVCSLVPRSEMAAAIGQNISSAKPDGPDLDKDTDSKTWTCTYEMANGILAVSVAEFPSTAAARKVVTLENLRKELSVLEIQITEEKGIGDRAFLYTDEGGLVFSVLKGARYVAVTGAGNKFSPDRLKASLRKIAGMLLPKL
jgi:hypothetical protein